MVAVSNAASGKTAPASSEDCDPLQLARGDMKLLKRKIKGVVEKNLGSGDKTHPILKSSSKDFFERPEKTWRPMATLLFAKAMAPQLDESSRAQFLDDAMIIAEIIEIMHTSCVIHDTVLEDYQALEKGNPAHTMYSSSMAGNKVSILAGDFLLSRASVLLASLRYPAIVEAMAGALESNMKAQIQLHRPMEQVLGADSYVRNVETGSGHLLGAGFQCIAILAGHERKSELAVAAFALGSNLGTSYQITKDLKATEGNYEKLLKKLQDCMSAGECPPFEPYELNEPLQRAGPLMFAAGVYPELSSAATEGFSDVASLLRARELIVECKAVDAVRKMATDRAKEAREEVDKLVEDSEFARGLKTLCTYVVEPDQARLQRRNYKEDGTFLEPTEQKTSGTQLVAALKDAKKGAQMGMFSVREQVKERMAKWKRGGESKKER